MEHLYFNHLTTVQKNIYKELMKAYMEVMPKYEFKTKATVADAFSAKDAVYYDHPGIFWFPADGQTFYSSNGMVVSVEIKYNDMANDIQRRQKELDEAVKEYTDLVRGKDLLTAELMINDKLVRDVNYEHGDHDQTAYAALVEKKAVCSGYSRAFMLIMMKIGIECTYCIGDVYKSDTKAWGCHAWNIIHIGNDWYNVDVTWNDAFDKAEGNKLDHSYFNCADSTFEEKRKRNKDCKFLPRCKGKSYTFEKITGTSIELDKIYQDGVTIRKPVSTAIELNDLLIPIIKKSEGYKPLSISLPVNSKKVCMKSNFIFADAVRYAGSTNWSYRDLSGKYADYGNGWFKLEMNFTLVK